MNLQSALQVLYGECWIIGAKLDRGTTMIGDRWWIVGESDEMSYSGILQYEFWANGIHEFLDPKESIDISIPYHSFKRLEMQNINVLLKIHYGTLEPLIVPFTISYKN